MPKIESPGFGGNQFFDETQDHQPAVYDITQYPRLGRFDDEYEDTWHLQRGRRSWRVVSPPRTGGINGCESVH
jgi:hypothetical protein